MAGLNATLELECMQPDKRIDYLLTSTFKVILVTIVFTKC